MTLAPYSKSKPSGFAWLGNVPAHWEVMRLKFLARVRPSNVDKHIKDAEARVRLCNYVDVYNNQFITADMDLMLGSATKEEIEKFSLKAGDVLITKDSESWSDIAVPALVKGDLSDVVCGYHLAQIRSGAGAFHSGYLFRLFCSEMLNYQFRVSANGVTRYGLPLAAIENAILLRPPFDEQREIAEYLDRETARIDALVAKNISLLERIEERRTALVSEALFQSRHRIPFSKDGVDEWFARIPQHWSTSRVKFVTEFITSGSRGWAAYYSDEGATFLQSGNIGRQMDLNFDLHQKVSPPVGAEGARTLVALDDVLVCITGARTGAIGLVGTSLGEAYINQHIALLRPNRARINPRFLSYCLWSQLGQQQLWLSSYGLKDGLGLQDVLNVKVVLPSLSEQGELVGYFDSCNARLNKVAAKIAETIGKLREYRSALITNAVTGKIDVRSQAQREAAE